MKFRLQSTPSSQNTLTLNWSPLHHKKNQKVPATQSFLGFDWFFARNCLGVKRSEQITTSYQNMCWIWIWGCSKLSSRIDRWFFNCSTFRRKNLQKMMKSYQKRFDGFWIALGPENKKEAKMCCWMFQRTKIDERFHIKFMEKLKIWPLCSDLNFFLKFQQNPWKFPPSNQRSTSLRKLARVETETCTQKCSKVQSTWWLFAD
jgi:hypothetical protein